MNACNSTYVKFDPKADAYKDNPFDKFDPNFKGTRGSNLFREAALERHRRSEAAKRVNGSFWFLSMLLVGVLLRLFGFLPSVEFDIDEDGNLKEDSDEMTRKRVIAIRRVIRACALLAFGIDPYKAIHAAFLDENGKVASGSRDALALLGEYISTGGHMYGQLDLREIMGIFTDIESPSEELPDAADKTFVPKVGLPLSETPSPRVSPNDERDQFSLVNSLSPAQQLLHWKQRLVNCECFKQDYFSGSFPIDPFRQSGFSPISHLRNEAFGLLQIFFLLVRQLSDEQILCDRCFHPSEYHCEYSQIEPGPGLNNAFTRHFHETFDSRSKFSLTHKYIRQRVSDSAGSPVTAPPPYTGTRPREKEKPEDVFDHGRLIRRYSFPERKPSNERLASYVKETAFM